MTDNIMPHRFFQTLIPRLGQEVPGLCMFYEQKANLSLEQVTALARAGVTVIQPGIEALSTDLLRRMDKGVTARQNIALLRHARAVGVEMNWNLLYGFPGDGVREYRHTLALLPCLRHRPPPTDVCRISIDRFSPYFFAPARYGIRSVRPMDSYAAILPPGPSSPSGRIGSWPSTAAAWTMPGPCSSSTESRPPPRSRRGPCATMTRRRAGPARGVWPWSTRAGTSRWPPRPPTCWATSNDGPAPGAPRLRFCGTTPVPP